MSTLRKTVIIGSLLLPACTPQVIPTPRLLPVSPLVRWVEFVRETDPLTSAELVIARDSLRESYQRSPSNGMRMRLAYLLSRPNAATQNFARSQALLAEIGPDSRYVPLRNMIQREITLMINIKTNRQKLQELHSQLNMLKAIDGDLTESQKAIDEVSQ